MVYTDQVVVGFISFGRNVVGLIVRPYETMRRIVDHGSLWELPFLAVLLAFYFSLASLVKTAAFRPFVLTRQFVALGGVAALTYVLVASLLWLVGNRFGDKGSRRGFYLAWAYTLLPTVSWFFMTSLLYVIFPPPRTARPQGVALSLLFLVVSATLFYWKAALAYLALRFGMKLDLPKILLVVGISVPVLALYSIGMYRLGIFRVPFL